jgi:hypothetical protein
MMNWIGFPFMCAPKGWFRIAALVLVASAREWLTPHRLDHLSYPYRFSAFALALVNRA